MKKVFVFVSIILVFIVSGCATTGEIQDRAQNDAQMRTIGRGIGAALVMADPGAVPGAREYCQKWDQVQDIETAEDLIREALAYFVEDYAEKKVMIDAIYDALVAIGFDDSAIQGVLNSGSVEDMEIPDMNAETVGNVKLIIDGFCSMTGLAGL